MLFWLTLSALFILVFAWWAARRATKPLTRFAEAADRLGVDVAAPRLSVAGPPELRKAAHAFNRMQERIRRLVDDRTQMLAAIAHDLRTALTRLRLRAELIEDPEQQAKVVADLEGMTVMLDETLAFARDDATGEERVEVDLAALVQSLCADLADAGQPVRYAGPDRLRLACRPVALRRALANLIDNAVKYGEVAEVALAALDHEIELTVADRGPGIPPEQRERVFTPFFRLEPSRSRETGGAGLGLAVARTILHRHGGEITLDNQGGLLVRVTLPRPRA
jgi:signal transduction histidine kinase